VIINVCVFAVSFSANFGQINTNCCRVNCKAANNLSRIQKITSVGNKLELGLLQLGMRINLHQGART